MSPSKSVKEPVKQSKDNKASSSEFDEIIKKIEELTLKIESLTSNTKKKVKRTITYKVPDDSNRCSEIRKNGERCAGRLAKGNKKLCQLHLNNSKGIDPHAAKYAKKASKVKADDA
jgi:hypothetical protein